MTKLSRNALYNLFGQLTVLALGFMATRSTYRAMGADVVGIIYFALTLSTVIQAGVLGGLNKMIIGEVSATHASDQNYLNRYFQTANTLFLLVFAVIVVGLAVLTPWIVDDWLNLSNLNSKSASWVLLVLTASALTTLVASLYSSVLDGFQDMGYSNLIRVLSAGFRQFGLIAIIAMGGNLAAITIWTGIWLTFPAFAFFARLRKYMPWSVLLRPGWDKHIVTRNRALGLNMMLLSLLTVLRVRSDQMLISALLPLAVLGYYSFLFNALARANVLQSALGTAAFPRLASAGLADDIESVRSLHKRLEDLQTFGTLPIFAALAFGLMPLMTVVFSADVARMTLVPGLLLIVGLFLGAMNSPSSNVALAMRNTGIVQRTNLYGLLITLPLSAILIYRYGLLGAGIGALVGALFPTLYQTPMVYKHCMGIPVRKWIAYLAKVFLIVLVTYGIPASFLLFSGQATLWQLAVGYAVGTIAFVVAAFLFADRASVEYVYRVVSSISPVNLPALPRRL